MLRLLSPSLIETSVYSCAIRFQFLSLNRFATDASDSTEKDDINDVFINRNPRNLEMMGIAKKRKGWKFQYPTNQFYHRLVFERENRAITGYVEHSSGDVVVSASSKELAIAKHLYSRVDGSAAENVGRVLARRCLQCGITNMTVKPESTQSASEKHKLFQQAMEDGGVTLSEVDETSRHQEPGIAYDDEYEYGDLIRRQKMAAEPSLRADYTLKKRTVPKRFRRNPFY